MMRYKAILSKVFYEPFEEIIIDADNEIDARLQLRNILAEKQKGIEEQIVGNVDVVNFEEKDLEIKDGKNVPF